mgnify:CR=1 FL=1
MKVYGKGSTESSKQAAGISQRKSDKKLAGGTVKDFDKFYNPSVTLDEVSLGKLIRYKRGREDDVKATEISASHSEGMAHAHKGHDEKKSKEFGDEAKWLRGKQDSMRKGIALADKKMKGKARVNASMPKHPYMEETLEELHGKGSLPHIAAYHTKKSAESKEQMEKTRSGNKKLPVPKKVTDKVSAKDSAAKYHAHQAKRAKGMMEEEQIDEVSKGSAIRAYAAGSTYNYDDEHPKSDAIKSHIVRKFGKKAGEHAERAAYTSLYGRDDRSNRVDQLAHAKPSSEMRKTKSGKIHKQDVGAKKDEIKFRKSMKKFEKQRGPLPEETLDEKLTKKMSAGDVISDFVHSDDPKFKGKSKKERQKMALGAYYGMHPEKSKK